MKLRIPVSTGKAIFSIVEDTATVTAGASALAFSRVTGFNQNIKTGIAVSGSLLLAKVAATLIHSKVREVKNGQVTSPRNTTKSTKATV